MMWREWMVTVHKTDDDRVDVSVRAFFHPALEDQGKCLGYVSNYYGDAQYKGTCVVPPYGNGLFLSGKEDAGNKASNSPQVLTMKAAAAAEGEFVITAANKPDECSRALAVEDCNNRAVLVEDPVKYFTDSKKYTTWVLTKRYDVVASGTLPPAQPSAPPAVAPSPSTPNTPSTPALSIPGPVISAPNTTSLGYVDVLVQSIGGGGGTGGIIGTTGGNARCFVTTIVITVANTASAPATYEIPASRPNLSSLGVAIPVQVGENSISAVGMCKNGESTERSQVLSISVIYLPAGGAEPAPKFYLDANGVTIKCPDAQVGETGVVNGITYTKRDGAELRSLVGSTDEGELVTSCTSGVTTMEAMFAVRLVLSLFGRLCAVVFDSSGWCLGPVIIHMCVCVCSGISVSVFVCVWLCGWVVVVHTLGVVG
jgi:hypothetical protein